MYRFLCTLKVRFRDLDRGVKAPADRFPGLVDIVENAVLWRWMTMPCELSYCTFSTREGIAPSVPMKVLLTRNLLLFYLYSNLIFDVLIILPASDGSLGIEPSTLNTSLHDTTLPLCLPVKTRKEYS